MRPIVKEGLKEEKNNRAAVWRLEVDYELATLFEAMRKKMKSRSNKARTNLSDLEKNGFDYMGEKAIVKTNRMNGSFLRGKGYFSFSLIFHCRLSVSYKNKRYT